MAAAVIAAVAEFHGEPQQIQSFFLLPSMFCSIDFESQFDIPREKYENYSFKRTFKVNQKLATDY